MSETLSWFAARLLFEATVDGDSGLEPLFEEKVILVRSESGMKDAETRARKLAKSAVAKYENVEGEEVAWQFKELLDIVQLNESTIDEGSEVYSHFLSAAEVDQIRESLKSGSLG